MTLAPLGDSAVVAALGEAGDEATLARVRLLAAALEHARLPGVVDVVPAYGTVTLFYQACPGEGGSETYARLSRALAAAAKKAHRRPLGRRLRRSAPERVVEIPVCYGGDYGPDLGAVAERTGLAAERVAELHSQGAYRVQAIGFSPGFPYLSGLAPELHVPRLPAPRPKVPAGSVGIGGSQTGVYPLESPGGWQLIGRTPLSLFLPGREPPALLRVGDRVRFRPIPAEEFPPAPARAREAPPRISPRRALVRVIRPGLFTTVQDLGRRGLRAAGVPLSGAMDAFALRVANLLVGNPEGAAALEATVIGPEIEFGSDALAAVTGAEFEGVPAWRPLFLKAGERLKFGPRRRGCRAYLAVSGGFDVPAFLGSRSTTPRIGLGGLDGRALREGDVLPLGPAGPARRRSTQSISPSMLPPYAEAPTLRAVRGAQAGLFEPRLWSEEFEVRPDSDRMGIRLAGPSLEGAGAALLSSAVAPGTVQVPPDGHPIVLMADAQTIGGYAQAAHVISCDLPLAAQLQGGDRIRFHEVTLEEAHQLAQARERDLALLRTGFSATA